MTDEWVERIVVDVCAKTFLLESNFVVFGLEIELFTSEIHK